MRRLRLNIFFCLALSLAQTGHCAETGASPSDSAIRQILVDRVDTQKQSVGIVVGVIDAKGRRVVSYGALDKGDKRPLDGDTVFEIGSITKVFTALLLTDMAHRGEVKIDDPIARYLPGTAKIQSGRTAEPAAIAPSSAILREVV